MLTFLSGFVLGALAGGLYCLHQSCRLGPSSDARPVPGSANAQRPT